MEFNVLRISADLLLPNNSNQQSMIAEVSMLVSSVLELDHEGIWLIVVDSSNLPQINMSTFSLTL